MQNRVVALSGYKKSGKDTAASHLIEKYGYEKLSFAASLKQQVAHQYSIHPSMLEDQSLKEEPIPHLPVIPTDKFTESIHSLMSDSLKSGYWTPRALLILEGSIKRSVNANYWVSRCVSVIKNNPNKRYVITDLRYKSEADTLKMLLKPEELLLLRIQRYQDIDTQDPSERDLDDYRFHSYIDNTRTIESLKMTLNMLMSLLGNGSKK